MVRLFDVVLNLGEDESLLVRRAAELLGVPVEHVRVERLVRKSLDARRNRPPRFVCVLDVSLPDEERVIERVGGKLKLKPMNESTPPPTVRRSPAPKEAGCRRERPRRSFRVSDTGVPGNTRDSP